MQITDEDLLLVTGATGLVGSHVVERARERGIRTRVLVRRTSDTSLLENWGVEVCHGDMADPSSLKAAIDGVTVLVHCAAKVGDWGPLDGYRAVNVSGLETLLEAADSAGTLKRMVHISSLGVYAARDHHGTSEDEPASPDGIDGYTLTKYEAEQLVLKTIRERQLPATVLRPGFIYGPRDRTVLPKLVERIRTKTFAFLGSGEQLMNNTYVGNLVEAIFLAIAHDETLGQVYNITDDRLVSKREFMSTVATLGGMEVPSKSVPLGVAKVLAKIMEGTWRLLGKREAPLLSGARIKFLGLNLDFSIDKAKQDLRYQPTVSFADGMQQTMDWYREQNRAA